MINEKDTIRCKAIFNDDHTHRFVLSKVWDNAKPVLAVISLNPAIADTLIQDMTTCLIVTNVARLEKYGGVVILNLYSKLTNKLNFRWNSDEDLNEADNDRFIKQYAEECETIVLAWGKSGETNQRIAKRIGEVMELLSGLDEKIYLISDGVRTGLHPLTPSIRQEWFLEHLEAQPAKTSGPAPAGSQKTEEKVEEKEES